MSWNAVIVMTVGAYLFKAFGVLVLGRLTQRSASTFQSLVALIPAALFAALIAVQTFELEGSLQIDARLAGVAAGTIAALRKAPLVLVVVVAMAVTALFRWQTLV